MGLQIGVLLTYAGVIILIFIVGKLFVWPIKLVLKLLASSLIAGVLGIPGLVMLLIFSLF